MKISTKILIFIASLYTVAIMTGCNEEFGSDAIKEGTDKPALNYFYTYQHNYGYPTEWLYFGPHSLIESSDNGPVTAMEWNTTFSVVSSFPLSDIKIESTEPWLTCKRLEGATFSITATAYNISYESEHDDRTGHVYIIPANITGGDKYDYKIDVEVTQRGRDLILSPDGIWQSSSNHTISFAENGGTSKTYGVRADGEYTISKDPNDSWYNITHSKANNTFFVTTTSTSSSTREGSIKVALAGLPYGESKEINFKVVQAGRNLSVYSNGSPISLGSSIILPVNGGESLTYEVRADGEYIITKGLNDTWYNITHSKINNTFFVTATENTTNSTKEGLITIALTGLSSSDSKEINLKVTQHGPIGVTIDDNYGQDENWDL